MISTTQLDLAEFRKAVLRSERVRTLCMIVVFGMFVLLGMFRVLVPVEGRVFIGAAIFGYSLVYFVLEIVMLRRVVRAIRADRPLSRALVRAQLILESLFPLGIMHALMLLVPEFRYTLLV